MLKKCGCKGCYYNMEMEEDIKILEERVTMLKRHIKNYEESDCKTNVYQQLIKECDATVNVLHELKYNKVQFETQLREKLDLQANSIPISVIQNKLDEQYELFNSENQKEYSQDIVNILEELLEERNK